MTGVRGALDTAGRWVDSRRAVTVAALLAFALRLPGLALPVRADEAGFLLVARSWSPAADTVYGPHFVDRHPLLIATFRAVDLTGGPAGVRILGALCCGVAVLLAAWVGGMVATRTAGRWSAVVVAALCTNPLIDPVAVKGELLGLPLVLLAIGASLCAIRAGSTTGTAGWALLAGAAGMTAPAYKQSMVGGLVFAAVLIAVDRFSVAGGRRPVRLVAVVGGLLAGAALPVLGTWAWAVAAGVRLESVTYALFGFRSDAAAVLAASDSAAPVQRLGLLVVVALGAGIVAILAGFLVHFGGEWADNRTTAAATMALLAVEVAGLVAGGSFWRDYLFPLIPAMVLCVALLARRPSRRGARMRVVALLCAGSTVISLVVWGGLEATGTIGYTEARTGDAVGDAAEPGDTLVVFGGRADLQARSGLRSPYRHLWSLPMRTLDPEYADLRTLVAGRLPPTWLVEWVSFTAWDRTAGEALRSLVAEEYVEHGTGCGGARIWLHAGVSRAVPAPECD